MTAFILRGPGVCRDLRLKWKPTSKLVEMHLLAQPDFKSLFESLPGLYLILTPELRIVAASDAYLEATMTSREQILGKLFFDAMPGNPSDPYGSVKNLKNSFDHVLHSKEPHAIAMQHYDFRKPDGNFDECCWHFLNTPLVDKNQEISFIIHRAERAAIETFSSEGIREILDRITDGFIALDKHFCFTYLNRKAGEIIHHNPAALIGKYVWSIFPDATGSAMYEALNKAMNEQQYVRSTDYYAPLNLWLENHIYPSPEGLSVFVRDITEQKRIERDIQEASDLAEKLIDSLPGVFYFFDATGKFIRWNRQFESVTGYSAEEIAGMHPTDFFGNEEKQYIAERIEGVFTKGINDAEAQFITKTGEKIPYYFKAVLLEYNGGPCLLGNGIDITERKKAQEKLEISENRFRSIIEQFPYPVATYHPTGDYINANKAWEDMWLTRRENAVGYNIRKDKLLIRLGVSFYVERAFAGDVTISEPYMFDPALIGQSGPTKWMVMTLYPLKNEQNEVKEVVSILQDVTETKEAEEELRTSEQKYKLLFKSNPLPMWMLSLPDYRFVDVNNAALAQYGYTYEEFRNLSILDLRLEEDIELFIQKTNKSFRGVHKAGIWRHRKKDGTIIFVDVITHDVVYRHLPTRLVMANDVTEKYQAQEKLQESYESIRQLSMHLQQVREEERAHMAREIHDELGQLLTVLKMDVSWLKKKIGAANADITEKFRELLDMITKTVATVRRIASELRPTLLDDLGLVAAIEWHLEEFEKRSGIHKEFVGPEQEPEIADSMKIGLFRIFQESLTNVARHSGAQNVDVQLHRQNGKIILKIIDDGKGFDPENATKKTLGLLGMKERTQMMGGVYHISGIPGKGTTVEVIVPVQTTT